MKPGSAFLGRLNAPGDHRYPIYSYVRLRDVLVGAENAAPPGETPWWVDTPPLESPHAGAMFDKRILADIFLRLREEPPFTRSPPPRL